MGKHGGGNRRPHMLRTSIPAVLALLLMIPGASAAEQASGAVDVKGRVDVENLAQAHAQAAHALLAPDLFSSISLRVTNGAGQAAEVCYVERTYVTVKEPFPQLSFQPVPDEPKCYTDSNLTLSLEGAAEGDSYVGFYPIEMGLTFEDAKAAHLEFWDNGRLASNGAETTSLRPTDAHPRDRHYYVMDVNTSHVVVEASGLITGTMTGHLKVLGLPVHVSSDSGPHTFETGIGEPSGPAGEQKRRWVFVTLKNADFVLESGAPVLAAVEGLQASTSGKLSFRAMSGSIVSSEATYSPRRAQTDSINGTFSTTLIPRDGVGNVGTLTLQGTVAGTSMVRVPVPPGAEGAAASSLSLLLLGAVLGGGAAVAVGAVVLYRRRMQKRVHPALARGAPNEPAVLVTVEHEEPESLERLLEKATTAAAWADWASALRLVRRAQHEAPDDADLRRSEGRYLSRLGHHEEALAAYEVAAVLGDAVAYVDAAVCAWRMRDEPSAKAFLEKALEADPTLAAEIEREPALEILREDEEVQRLLRDARERA